VQVSADRDAGALDIAITTRQHEVRRMRHDRAKFLPTNETAVSIIQTPPRRSHLGVLSLARAPQSGSAVDNAVPTRLAKSAPYLGKNCAAGFHGFS
jgi:hypothetical protein